MLVYLFADFAGVASAGELQGPLLKIVQSEEAGVPVFLVQLPFVPVGQPSCHNSLAHGAVMFFDLRTENGRSAVVTLNAAFFLGKPVRVYGTGTCTLHPAIETARAVEVVQ